MQSLQQEESLRGMVGWGGARARLWGFLTLGWSFRRTYRDWFKSQAIHPLKHTTCDCRQAVCVPTVRIRIVYTVRMQHDVCRGSFLLAVTELSKIIVSVPTVTPFFHTLPQTFLQVCIRVQSGYGLLSTTSQALSVHVWMLAFLLTFSH